MMELDMETEEPELDDPFRPITFQIDRGHPETEPESGSILELIQTSPEWKQEYALELAHLVRSNIVVRSAIGFALELANNAVGALRNPGLSKKEFRFQQGRINALEQYTNSMVSMMMEAEQPAPSKEQEDESA